MKHLTSFCVSVCLLFVAVEVQALPITFDFTTSSSTLQYYLPEDQPLFFIQDDLTLQVAASNEDKTIESIKLLQANTSYLDRVAQSYFKTPEENPRKIVCDELLSPRLAINLDGETLYPALYTDHFDDEHFAKTVITIGEPDDTNALAFRELLKDIAFEKEEGKL